MRPENQSGNLAARSPTENTVNHFNKRSKISYTRNALISLANLDKSISPPEVSSTICECQDAANLDSGLYVTDSASCRCSPGHLGKNSVHDGILGKKDSVEVSGISVPEAQSKSDHLMHKSDEPYRLPHLYKKALESENSEACKSSNVGYSDGNHRLESEECYYLVHELSQRSGGTSENCPSWRESLEKGTVDDWQSLAAFVTGFDRTYEESELETYMYPTWMFGNGSKFPGSIHDNNFGILGSGGTIRNPRGSDIGIEKDLKLNQICRSNYGSDLGVELNLPDEDSLHTFDETYFVPNKEERIGYEDFNVSSMRNSIGEQFSASSLPIVDESLVESVPDNEPQCLLNDMVEKVVEHVLKDETPCSPFDMVEMPAGSVLDDETSTLSLDLDEKSVESVLDDESPSPPIDFDKLVDSIVDETPSPFRSVHYPLPTNFSYELEWLSPYQKLHMVRSYPQYQHLQLNSMREVFHTPSHDQVDASTREKSPNTKTDPLRLFHLPRSMISHPLHLLDGEQRRFECKKGHPLLHPVPTGETFPFSLHQKVHREAPPPYLPTAFPMACHERELSPLQNFNAYKQPNYWVSTMANPGVHGYDYNYNNSRPAVDGLLNMRLRGMHIDT